MCVVFILIIIFVLAIAKVKWSQYDNFLVQFPWLRPMLEHVMAWPEYISYISYITFISHFAHVQLRTASGYAHADSFPDTDLFCWYFTFKTISSQV